MNGRVNDGERTVHGLVEVSGDYPRPLCGLRTRGVVYLTKLTYDPITCKLCLRKQSVSRSIAESTPQSLD